MCCLQLLADSEVAVFDKADVYAVELVVLVKKILQPDNSDAHVSRQQTDREELAVQLGFVRLN